VSKKRSNAKSGKNIKSDANTSGMGKGHKLPEGIKGWSWGAFLFNWAWAIHNRTWIGALVLVPYLGFIMAFVLGFKGREWAWQNKRWDNIEHFQAVQKKWSFWSAACLIAGMSMGLILTLGVPLFHILINKYLR